MPWQNMANNRQWEMVTPNNAMDSDNYSAPLRAPIIAHHRGRWATKKEHE